MDKEVLFPGESKQRGPAPECTPQILSHSAFLFSRGGLRRLCGLRVKRCLGRRLERHLGRRLAANQPETVQGQRQQEEADCDSTNHLEDAEI